jgi:hypothetical protein
MPSAQFEIGGLSEAVEGLWVRRSGRTVWTRVKLPRHYREIMFANEAFMSRYRVAASADRDERFGRLLLSEVFVGWLLERAPQEEGFLAIGTSFELWRGVVFIRGPRDAFQDLEKLAAFAAAAAQIADCVRTVVNALQQGSPPPPGPAGAKPVDRAMYGAVADSIETGLRALGAWGEPTAEGSPQGAFGAPERSFTQWVQYDLLPRLREVAAGREEPPEQSMAGTRALRELDGVQGADPLIDALLDLDRLVEAR